MTDNSFRDVLKKHVHYSLDPEDVNGRMESTFQMLLKIEPLWQKFKRAESKGQFKGLTFQEHLEDAVTQSFVTAEEASQIAEYNIKRFDSMLTDIFDMKIDQTLPLDNPYIEKEL